MLVVQPHAHLAVGALRNLGIDNEGETLDALYAGASAILPRSAASTEIATMSRRSSPSSMLTVALKRSRGLPISVW
jgi:hypothetical protein